MQNQQLRKQLLRMQTKDQKMRQSKKWDIAVDKENTEKLKKIIVKYGWPIRKLVGVEGETATWLIAQHADHDVSFQEKCLKLMAENNSPKNLIAMLTDRVLINQGKKQKFGTQFYQDDFGIVVPRPIIDQKNLDKRRSKYGLIPFEEYRKIMQSKK